MSGNEIRTKFLSFMEKRGHAIIPSSGLVPENDPTTLFTGSGMQPMVPFLMGERHPMGTRIADSQKCFRAEDIDEVGDNRHTTFFEMLGNWSFGDYFKKEQLEWIWTFLTKDVGLDPKHMYVTVFAGDEKNDIPKDTESVEIWQRLLSDAGVSNDVAHIGSIDEGAKRGVLEGERIFYYESRKNWWSRAGVPEKMPIGEPGGPDSEIFYDFGTPHDPKFGEKCHPNCDCGRFLEICNSVFMEYIKNQDGSFSKLPMRNVDFGGGLERIAAASNDDPDVYKVDLLHTTIEQIEQLTGKTYSENPVPFRIITDHIRGAAFMISEEILPSNTEQGYFTRRLLRRAIRYADILGIPHGELRQLAKSVIDSYKQHYGLLRERETSIMDIIHKEEMQFRKTLENGLREFNKIALKVEVPIKKENGKVILDASKMVDPQKFITGENAFNLFTTYGFPIELTVEIAKERGMTVARNEFDKLMEEHREKSRLGAEQKFKGGLADHSEKVVMYHTATHLLLAGLRKELGKDVHQAGSNITGERMRFDFTYDGKVPEDVLKRVEDYVNNAIQKNARVTIETLDKDDAMKDPSIEGSFWDRYPDHVKVYTITDDSGTIYSRELCGGPHVEATSSIAGTFKIQKEESSSKGVRRIKAILE